MKRRNKNSYGNIKLYAVMFAILNVMIIPQLIYIYELIFPTNHMKWLGLPGQNLDSWKKTKK
jgi:hypothetical protein